MTNWQADDRFRVDPYEGEDSYVVPYSFTAEAFYIEPFETFGAFGEPASIEHSFTFEVTTFSL